MSATPTPQRPAPRRGPTWSLFPELEAAFGLLSTGWAPLGVQGRAVAAQWPDRLISVGELRARLLHPACPYPTRDRVLNTVLHLARAEGEPWLLVLVGLLLPGLRRSARTLLLANPGLAADLEAEMFTGLLTAIRTGPAIRARPGAELIWAARRAAPRTDCGKPNTPNAASPNPANCRQHHLALAATPTMSSPGRSAPASSPATTPSSSPQPASDN